MITEKEKSIAKLGEEVGNQGDKAKKLAKLNEELRELIN